MQTGGQLLRRAVNLRHHRGGNLVRRDLAGGVAGVNTRRLHVLHDGTDDTRLAVRDHIHIQLHGMLQEAVHQHGALRGGIHGLAHVGAQLLLIVHNHHGATAEHEGRPHQHGEPDAPRDAHGLFLVGRRTGIRLLQADFIQ